MEPNFPPNSQRPPRSRPEPAKKEIKRVVQGRVTRQKKPLGRRFRETFFGGNTRDVWGFMAWDILIPTAKDTIQELFTQGLERMLFPDAEPRRSRGRGNHRSYGSYYRSGGSRYDKDDRDAPRHMSRRGRALHDFEEIILNTRREAEDVLDEMFHIVNEYNVVSVEDLYSLVGIEPNYTDGKYGWEDISTARVEKIRDGYLLDLPRPEPLR